MFCCLTGRSTNHLKDCSQMTVIISLTLKWTVEVKGKAVLLILARFLASGIPFDLGHWYGDSATVKLPSMGYAASDLQGGQ